MTFSAPVLAPFEAAIDDRPGRLVAAARDLANETGKRGVHRRAGRRAGGAVAQVVLPVLPQQGRPAPRPARGRQPDRRRVPASSRSSRADPIRCARSSPSSSPWRSLPESAGYAGVLVREHRRLVEHRPRRDPRRARAARRSHRRAHRHRGSARATRARCSACCSVDSTTSWSGASPTSASSPRTSTGSARTVGRVDDRDRSCPIRRPRDASLHDHLGRRSPHRARATCSRVACPRDARRTRAPQVVTLDDGRETWVYEDGFYPQVGLNAVVGPAQGRVEHGAGALRRDAARLLRHRGARRRHGPRRRVRVAVLPVADRRVRGHRSSPRARTRSSASPRCGRGTTGTSRSGPARTPTASSRCSSRGCSDPEIAAADIRAQRRARLQGRELPREPGRPAAAVDAHRSLGSRSCARARRPRRSCACTTARRRGPRRARRARRSSCTRACSR